jgi:hypothetical protein
MGRLKYDSTADPVYIDDETLAHVKVVIATKLRRQESFMMTWCPVDAGSDGRLTVWIHPSVPLLFAFDDPDVPPIDPHRLEEMIRSVNATGELVLDHLIAPPR